MKRFGPFAVGCLFLAFALSGGCIRAVRTGFAGGVDSAISAFIETVITNALAPATGGGE